MTGLWLFFVGVIGLLLLGGGTLLAAVLSSWRRGDRVVAIVISLACLFMSLMLIGDLIGR